MKILAKNLDKFFNSSIHSQEMKRIVEACVIQILDNETSPMVKGSHYQILKDLDLAE